MVNQSLPHYWLSQPGTNAWHHATMPKHVKQVNTYLNITPLENTPTLQRSETPVRLFFPSPPSSGGSCPQLPARASRRPACNGLAGPASSGSRRRQHPGERWPEGDPHRGVVQRLGRGDERKEGQHQRHFQPRKYVHPTLCNESLYINYPTSTSSTPLPHSFHLYIHRPL